MRNQWTLLVSLLWAFPVLALPPAPVLFATSGQPTAFTIRIEPKRFLADETWYIDGDCVGRVVRGPVVSVQVNAVIADFSVYIARSRLGVDRIICLADTNGLPKALLEAMRATRS